MQYSNTLMHICYRERQYLFLGLCARLLLLGEHHFPLRCDLNAFPQRLLQLLNALLLLTEGVLQRENIQCKESTKCCRVEMIDQLIDPAFIKEQRSAAMQAAP